MPVMDAWDRVTLAHRDHRDITVRLHGGPHHGKVITLPLNARDLIYTTPPMPSWSWDEPLETAVEMPVPPIYRCHRLATYDDIDHAVDTWDYWLHEGDPLPKWR